MCLYVDRELEKKFKYTKGFVVAHKDMYLVLGRPNYYHSRHFRFIYHPGWNYAEGSLKLQIAYNGKSFIRMGAFHVYTHKISKVFPTFESAEDYALEETEVMKADWWEVREFRKYFRNNFPSWEVPVICNIEDLVAIGSRGDACYTALYLPDWRE